MTTSASVTTSGSVGGRRDNMPRPRRRILTQPGTLTVVSTVTMLAIWHVLGMMAGPLFLPTPTQTVEALYDTLVNGELKFHIWSSVKVFLLGFTTASVSGVLIGIVAGYSRIAGGLLQTPFTIFWSTPVVALIPLMVIWVGLNVWTQVIIVFLCTLFPVAINTQAGVRNVDSTLLDVAAVFGKDRATTFLKVIVPAAAPHIGSGLRLGVGRAVIGVYVAELFTGTVGLGARMSYFAAYFQTAEYFAALIVFIVFSVVVTRLVVGLTNRWSQWKTDEGDR